MPRIWVLGPLEVGGPADQRAVPVRRKQRELLALLLTRAGNVVSPGEIMDSLWGEHPPPSARANLHTYVSGLRRLLGGAAARAGARPERVRHGYRLDLCPDESDAVLFERLARQGRTALVAERPAEAVDHLTRALALWRGPVLACLDRHDWLAPTAARLEETRLASIEDHTQARLALGHYAGLTVELAAATRQYPLRERLWGQLMVALDQSGRRPEALLTYRRLHDLLGRELGVPPGPAVRTLYQQILTGGCPISTTGPAAAG
ncbi:AfsR/SARP family transcriptional regulator [Micromonospora sp. BQ11]|uniref:AfsR/SARP family transcriptional regulator n=1 Tax=Micromonospora sp. BQ11 TaxID=3452212 RepID=UPI003F8AC3CA